MSPGARNQERGEQNRLSWPLKDHGGSLRHSSGCLKKIASRRSLKLAPNLGAGVILASESYSAGHADWFCPQSSGAQAASAR